MESERIKKQYIELDNETRTDFLTGDELGLAYARRAGGFRVVAERAISELMAVEKRLSRFEGDLARAIDRGDVVVLLARFAATTEREARVWMESEGYFADSPPDTGPQAPKNVLVPVGHDYTGEER
jgi:hypothetical protein